MSDETEIKWSDNPEVQQVMSELVAGFADYSCYFIDLTPESCGADVNLSAGSHVHNWRTHIPDPIADVWERLPVEARACVYAICEIAASNERWE